jgi:hypothetical protein
MTDQDAPRRVEIKADEQTVAAAEVSPEPDGTVRASLHAAAGHVAPGCRGELVDAVMDLPEVQRSKRLKAAVPLGDGESLQRLRERTENLATRPAGSTALVDAQIRHGESGSQPERDRESPGP